MFIEDSVELKRRHINYWFDMTGNTYSFMTIKICECVSYICDIECFHANFNPLFFVLLLNCFLNSFNLVVYKYVNERKWKRTTSKQKIIFHYTYTMYQRFIEYLYIYIYIFKIQSNVQRMRKALDGNVLRGSGEFCSDYVTETIQWMAKRIVFFPIWFEFHRYTVWISIWHVIYVRQCCEYVDRRNHRKFSQ